MLFGVQKQIDAANSNIWIWTYGGNIISVMGAQSEKFAVEFQVESQCQLYCRFSTTNCYSTGTGDIPFL